MTSGLVLISPPTAVADEHLKLSRLFDAGLQSFHLRKPSWTREQEYEEFVRQHDAYRQRIVIHHPSTQLASRLRVKGLHYTERTRPLPPLQPCGSCSISTSFHSLEQLEEDWGALDYAFLSPIFDSVSKPGYRAVNFDSQQLHWHLQNSPVPVVALGGITADTLREASRMGFAGAAMIGSVWQAEDPVAAFRELQAAWDT